MFCKTSWVCCVVLATLTGAAEGQTHLVGNQVLRGLEALEVVIEEPHPEAVRDGLDPQRLRTVTELVLRSAGIRVKTRDDEDRFVVDRTLRQAYLYVVVGSQKDDAVGLYGWSVRVELKELLQTLDGSAMMFGATWTKSATGTVGASLLHQLVDVVRRNVEEFANAFLEQNPNR